jgi:hypothetical protein
VATCTQLAVGHLWLVILFKNLDCYIPNVDVHVLFVQSDRGFDYGGARYLGKQKGLKKKKEKAGSSNKFYLYTLIGG